MPKCGLFSASKNASIVRGIASPLSPLTVSFTICALIKHDALPTRKHSFFFSGSSRLIWSPSPPSFISPPQISSTHVLEVSPSSCVLSRHLYKPRGGTYQDPAVWHVQLAHKRKGKQYSTLGSPPIAQPLAAVHRRSNLGVPLRDHHWYATQNAMIAPLLI